MSKQSSKRKLPGFSLKGWESSTPVTAKKKPRINSEGCLNCQKIHGQLCETKFCLFAFKWWVESLRAQLVDAKNKLKEKEEELRKLTQDSQWAPPDNEDRELITSNKEKSPDQQYDSDCDLFDEYSPGDQYSQMDSVDVLSAQSNPSTKTFPSQMDSIEIPSVQSNQSNKPSQMDSLEISPKQFISSPKTTLISLSSSQDASAQIKNEPTSPLSSSLSTTTVKNNNNTTFINSQSFLSSQSIYLPENISRSCHPSPNRLDNINVNDVSHSIFSQIQLSQEENSSHELKSIISQNFMKIIENNVCNIPEIKDEDADNNISNNDNNLILPNLILSTQEGGDFYNYHHQQQFNRYNVNIPITTSTTNTAAYDSLDIKSQIWFEESKTQQHIQNQSSLITTSPMLGTATQNHHLSHQQYQYDVKKEIT
eukprot:TRINITY_DN10677_c0_g1_i1.p1 TRINITY_DN10677_c0_g1~~TRINITY_DN10677_c0_g1_i1.p1  ORF type:complete len:424 (-),score=94.23 TRINITY_DN10677_c0_g1_i1:133-1404(-)